MTQKKFVFHFTAILSIAVAQLHFNIDGDELLDKVEEDERHFKVLHAISTPTKDTDWPGRVPVTNRSTSLYPWTQEAATVLTNGALALIRPMEQPVL